MESRTVGYAAGVMLLTILSSQGAVAGELRVISDRTPGHLEKLFSLYETATGTKIQAVFVDKGLLPRLTARPTEADVVISKTAEVLEAAKQSGLLRPFSSEKLIEELKPEFRDPEGQYITTSYRPRAIFYSKDRVDADSVATFEDLMDPQWRGRICLRSGYHNYNLSLWAQMVVQNGIDWTRGFLEKLHANLARPPKGNDRAQIRGIMEGVCDLAIANSYYMGIMQANPQQKPWADSAKLVFPNQLQNGAYVLRGGAALTAAERNSAEAHRLLEFLVSEQAQLFITNTTYAYSVHEGLPLPAVNRSLAQDQLTVTDGRFKANFVPLKLINELRPTVVEMLDEIDFDHL